MDISDLLARDFVVSDQLTGTEVSALDEIRQLANPWRASGRSDGHRGVDSELTSVRAEARRRALELVEATGFNLQALLVFIRAASEDNLAEGLMPSLLLVDKMLGEPWNGLEERIAQASDPAKESRQLSRHLDALFNHLYDELAREREVNADSLLQSFGAKRAAWKQTLEALNASLRRRRLAGAGWQRLNAQLDDCIAHAVAQTGQPAEGMPSGAVTGSKEREQPLASTGGQMTDGNEEPATVSLRVSPDFMLLERRLKAFELLLTRRDYEKAALVASDLHACLAAFDVTLFFPDLFAALFEGEARHADELEPYLDPPNTLRVTALRQLYRSALERFVGEERTQSERGR